MRPYILLLVFLVAGCGVIPGINLGTKTATDAVTGEEGIVISFPAGMPPATVQKGDDFPLAIELHNRGAAPVTNGLLSVVNYYPQFIQMDDVRRGIGEGEPLDGVSEGNSEGGYDLFTYDAKAIAMSKGATEERVLFKAKACYPYRTIAGTTVCINADNKPGDICQVHDVSMQKGQGAPVAVTGVDETMYPIDVDKANVQFTIHIQNFGQGKITGSDSFKKECEGTSIATSDLNKISVKVTFVGVSIEDKNCQSPVVDGLDPTKMTIFCSLAIKRPQSAYTTPLTVTLDYGYVNPEIFREVKILSPTANQACGGHCVELQKDVWGGTIPTVCPSAYGGMADGGCDEGKVCCKSDHPLCTDRGLTCNPTEKCQSNPIPGLCPGTLACCTPKTEACKTVCKTQQECLNGYGGVDSTGNCDQGVCCSSAQTCRDLVGYRCFSSIDQGYTTCQKPKTNLCRGDDKCCLESSYLWQTPCAQNNGICVPTFGYDSCEAFGGDVPGSCASGQRCCAKQQSACVLNHPDEFSSSIQPGKWACVDATDLGRCQDTSPTVLRGEGGTQLCSGQKSCCQIKHSCYSFHTVQGDWGTGANDFSCRPEADCREGSVQDYACQTGKCCQKKPA